MDKLSRKSSESVVRLMENDWITHTINVDLIGLSIVMFVYVMTYVFIEFIEIKDRKKKK